MSLNFHPPLDVSARAVERRPRKIHPEGWPPKELSLAGPKRAWLATALPSARAPPCPAKAGALRWCNSSRHQEPSLGDRRNCAEENRHTVTMLFDAGVGCAASDQ